MPTESYYPLVDNHYCLDPMELMRELEDQQGRISGDYDRELQPIHSDFWQRANSYTCPLGPEPGVAWFLLTRADIDAMDLDNFVEFKIRSSDGSGGSSDKVIAKQLLFAKATCMTPGATPEDPTAAYLAKFVDKRHVLAMGSTTQSGFGVETINARVDKRPGLVDGDDISRFFDTSLSTGTQITWTGVIQGLWGALPEAYRGATTPTLPYTPDGKPDNLKFMGVSAWESLHVILGKLCCALKYDPITDTFSIIKLGSTQEGLSASMNTQDTTGRRIDDYAPIEGVAARIPKKIRVYFHRWYDQWGLPQRTLHTYQFERESCYYIDKNSEVDGALDGTYAAVWDDLSAYYSPDASTLENSSALDARATEVAQNYVNKLQTSETWMRKHYTGIVTDILPGSEIKAVTWRDYGDGWVTEIMRSPLLPTNDPSRYGTEIGLPKPGCAERLLPPDFGRQTQPVHAAIRYGKAYENWNRNASGGGFGRAFVRCHPCDNNGADTDSGTSITIYLHNSHVSLGNKIIGDPNIETNDIVGYIPDENGELIAVTNYMDDPIGTVRMVLHGTDAVPKGWAVMDGSANSGSNGGSAVNLTTARFIRASVGSGGAGGFGGSNTHTHANHDIGAALSNHSGFTTGFESSDLGVAGPPQTVSVANNSHTHSIPTMSHTGSVSHDTVTVIPEYISLIAIERLNNSI